MFAYNVSGQLRDTSLSILYTKPFFFNVLKAEDGNVYAGSSEGILLMKGSSFKKLDERVGYLTVDNKGKLTIDSNGIRYHDQKSYLHLLPYPSEQRDEYHAGAGDHFYVTSGGRMHVFEILPYVRLYRNHSVRSSSQNFVATYSGIYYKGRKLPEAEGFPRFSDGYIRELNNKVFFCFSHLMIAYLTEKDSLPTPRKEVPKGFGFDFVRDILYSKKHNKYFVNNIDGIGSIDSDLLNARPLYGKQKKDIEVVLIGEDRNAILFAAGGDLMAHRPATRKNNVLATLPEQILDGHPGTLSHHLLTSQGLYAVHTDGQTEKLTNLYKAHTLLSLGNSTYAIATDQGLFWYNTISNKLSELIRGVEFNRRGLYLKGDSLLAGSIDGLYVLDTKNLEQLAEQTSNEATGQPMLTTLVVSLVGMTLIASVFTVLFLRSRKRLSTLIREKKADELPKATREDIEAFIRENLAVASLKSITDHFQTSNANVYMLLAPEKPGAFINRLRMEKVQQLRGENKTAKEIADLTGFSVSYVWKIWNMKE